MNLNEIQIQLEKIRSKKRNIIIDIENEIRELKEKHKIIIDFDLFCNDDYVSISEGEYLNLRDTLADIEFVNTIQHKMIDIPLSNGSAYFQKYDINIGIIADEFLYNSFKDIANFYYVHRERYKELKGKIDVLLIATAWKGLDNDWKGLGNPNLSKIRRDIFNVIDFFKQQGVKIVFYSKEDPTNYEFFVDIAKKCDYIFTTAAEKITDYKRECNNDKVFLLEFGVNPIYNNPIGLINENKQSGALFAGSWYEKYQHRQIDTKMLFDGVLEAGHELKIIDRNYWFNNKKYFFPKKYLKYISPSIEHELLQKILKLYTWVINLNSVKFSESMFANRVYELQAMGNLLLSNYSLGINSLFPNIFLVHDKNEIRFILNSISEIEKHMLQMEGVRKVLRSHTTFHRISTLLENIGYNDYFVPKKNVAVVVNEKNDNVIKSFERQTYAHKELMTINEIIDYKKQYDYVAFFSPDYVYGEYYLEDMVNGFKYTNSSYITKDSYLENGKKIAGVEHNYVNKMKDKCRTLFDVQKHNINDLISIQGEKVLENGYSIDRLELDTKNIPLFSIEPTEYKFSVIIPVYNNGEHLYGKCFMSLRRSSMYNNMEIIIVDDGSTNVRTIKIVDRLQRLYPNVKTYKFRDGGSGSASRPRNKGIELSTTNFITFLDPDNEAIEDGYTTLYKELMENDDIDLVIGDIIKIDREIINSNFYNFVIRYCNGQTKFTKDESKDFLKKLNFKAQSIQALMVKKNVITNKNLKMIDGAIGQDTLFFYELLINSNKFKVIDKKVHIYYSGVIGSTVNNINLNFFKKYEKLEEAKYSFLKKENLLDSFLSFRFNYYFKNWYLKKLEMINEEEKEEAIEVLEKIYNLYSKDLKRSEIDPKILNELKK